MITHSVHFGQSLIDDFSNPEKAPHIAISVDMLDIGIDVPEVVNLVFFKLVRSKTKFWQMLGRGTRLRPGLFGTGDDKEHFNVLDFCQNLEYFSQQLVPVEGAGTAPLNERIFKARLNLIQAMDSIKAHGDERSEVAETLREAIASMNENNFLVRPHLELVEKFRRGDAWGSLSVGDLAPLADRVAQLPTELDAEHEDAKRFDVLLLNVQLARLRGEPFERERGRMLSIASALEDQENIPVVAEQFLKDNLGEAAVAKVRSGEPLTQADLDELTERGVVETRRIYETPYISLAPEGPEDIVNPEDIGKILATIDELSQVTAQAT